MADDKPNLIEQKWGAEVARAGWTAIPNMLFEHMQGLGITPLDPENDRVMICGSMAMLKDVKTLVEGLGFIEGSNSEPNAFVVERAFVG